LFDLQDVIPVKAGIQPSNDKDRRGLSACPDDGLGFLAAINAPLSRSWSEGEAFAYCSRLTRSHYENFPVGSILIPGPIQPAIHSLYAFMRTADDFADEYRSPGDEAERLTYLKTWGQMLTECEQGEPRHPVFIALKRTLQQYRLPIQWLQDLLHAFTLDVTVRRYEAYSDILDYCRYSANPVGRLILTLFGYRDEELYRLSDSICTALQLANHWQDVSIDLDKDRIYLPQEDLKRFGVVFSPSSSAVDGSPAAAFGNDNMGKFRQLLAFEVARARELFSAGRPLPEKVRGRLRLELRMTWLGGVRVLDKIERVHYDVFQRRPILTKMDWFWIGCRALLDPRQGRSGMTS